MKMSSDRKVQYPNLTSQKHWHS